MTYVDKKIVKEMVNAPEAAAPHAESRAPAPGPTDAAVHPQIAPDLDPVGTDPHGDPHPPVEPLTRRLKSWYLLAGLIVLTLVLFSAFNWS
jgi:hypothetical protein